MYGILDDIKHSSQYFAQLGAQFIVHHHDARRPTIPLGLKPTAPPNELLRKLLEVDISKPVFASIGATSSVRLVSGSLSYHASVKAKMP